MKPEGESRGRSFDFHYQEDSDFLEIVFAYQPPKCLVEKVDQGIHVKRSLEDHAPVGVWVFQFRKSWERVRPVLESLGVHFPLKIEPAEPSDEKSGELPESGA